MKKWIGMLLILTVMLGCYGVFAQSVNAADAEEVYTEGDYTYTVANGEATITAYTGVTSGEIVIPSALGGYPVTAIGAGIFYDKGGITGVTIPDGVRTIGNSAFSWCESLQEVTIPDSVEVIDVNAFSICSSLERVSIGSGVKVIGGGAFYGCRVETTTLPNGLIEIGGAAFGGCDILESISIPDSITYVGTDAFPTNNCLAYHTYDNAKYLGNSENPYAVLVKYTAADITAATIHPDTKTIAGRAFHECKGLTEIVIPHGVKSIGDAAFEGCSGLTTISIPDSVLRIGNSAFNWCTGLTDVSIGDGVKEIGEYAFNECANLQAVSIGSSVTYIGIDAFGFCYNLSDVYITDLAAWCEMDFAGGSGTSAASPLCYAKNLYVNGELLTDLVIPQEVTEISPGAFNNCIKIESVKIHNGVTYIGGAAFARCSGIKSMSIPFVGERKEIGTEMYRYPFGYVFGYESYTGSIGTNQDFCYIDASGKMQWYYGTFYIPEGLETITITGGEVWHNAFGSCSSLKSVTLGPGVIGVGTSAFQYCSNLQKVNFSNNVTTIGDYAFRYCGSLQEIHIPDQVTNIGVSAFEECRALTKVTVGNGVAKIESCAFKNCTALSQVEIGSGVEEINGYAFENCTGLTAVYITDLAGWCQINFANGNYYGGGQTATPLYYARNLYLNEELLEHVVIPETVTAIAPLAFHNCSSLITVHIPEGVTSVGDSAFSDCSKLKEITIADSVTFIDNWAFGNCSELEKVTLSNRLASIGNSAFYGAKLTEVTIPDSVTTIGGSAFWACNTLTDVYYIGDPESWNKIGVGSLAFPAVTIHYSYFIGSDGTHYSTLEKALAAVEEGALLRLGGVLRRDAFIDKSLALDLNGYDILATITVAENCTLYCLDSQTDDYTVNDDKGYGKIRFISGNVLGLPENSDLAEDGYLMITEADGVSFHRVNLQLTAMTLRASNVGIYYKCTFAGDELVAQNVSRFGVALSVKGMPTTENLEEQCILSWFEGFEAGINGDDKNSTLLYGIMKLVHSDEVNAKNATMPIYGRAYIQMTDGQYVFGAAASRSLQQQVEEADAMWDQLDATQQAELIGMYQRYADVMQSWELPNLQAAISAPAAILPGKEELAA